MRTGELEDNVDLRARPVASSLLAVGAAGVLAPFLMKVERVSINNGAVTYRDWVAIVGGGTAILFALIAIVFVIRAKAPPLFAAVAILVGLGGYQIARGLGAFIKTETQPALAIDMPPPPPAPKACADKDACNKLADAMAKDDPSYAGLKERACNFGEEYACADASSAYLRRKDLAKSFAMDHKGCELKNRDACREEANDYLKGQGVAKDESKYIPMLEHACDLGELASCAGAAFGYLEGEHGTVKDIAKGVAFAKRAAGDGGTDASLLETVANACSEAGAMLANGDGIAKDEVAAVALFDKACGYSRANCKNLGVAFETGMGGVKKDHAHAVELWTAGCDAEGPASCEALAEVTKDPAKKKALVDRAKQLRAGAN